MNRTTVPTRLTASATVTGVTVPATITAADTSSRRLSGVILTYGEVGNTSAGRARFAAGALTAGADLSRVKLLIEHDPERVVGYAEKVDTDDAGRVSATFYVAPGPVGDELLASAAGKLRDGLSVGVQIIDATPAADGVLDVTAGALREVSAVTIPAFASAQVQTVAASGAAPQPYQYQPPAAGTAPAPYIGARAGGAVTGRTADQAVGAMVAAFRTGGPEAMMRAALADIVPPADAGQHDVMFRPAWLGELWKASETVRPFIDAFGGPKPLTAYKIEGFQRTGAGVVDEYAGNKAEIPTGPGGGITPVSATAKRQAGGNDIDRVFFDFGDASFLASYLALQADTYRENTENLFAADVVAGATALPASADALAAIKTVARALPRGASLGVVLVADDVWADLLDINQLDAPWLFGGTSTLTENGGTIGGVRFATAADLPAGTVLGADKRAASFYEWKNPPLAVQAVNLPNGGIDVAVFGYWTDLINYPAAIVKTTVTAG